MEADDMEVLVVFGENLEDMNRCWLQDWEKEGKNVADLFTTLEIDIKELEIRNLKLKDLNNKDKVAEKIALKIKKLLNDTVRTIKNIYRTEELLADLYQLTTQDEEEKERIDHFTKELSKVKRKIKNLRFTLYLYATEYTDRVYDLLTKDDSFFKNFPHKVSIVRKGNYKLTS